MSMTTEQIVDRRRMRRRLGFWRLIGIVALIGVVVLGAIAFAGRDAFPGLERDQIARVTIEGFIGDDRRRLRLLDEIIESDAVKAVVVNIDSTGGSTAGGEALYEKLKEVAEAKPTTATIASVGASAAYMAAIATDRIYARRTSITGSIGVLFQYPKLDELLDNWGVGVETIKSSPLKASPSPFEETTPAARAVIAALVRDSYDWFVDIVAEERGMERSEALRLADGRIYSGSQALEVSLIDAIGGEDAAIAWLGEEHDIDTDLPVTDWKVRDDADGLPFARIAAWMAEITGIDAVLGLRLADRVLPEALFLDGLMSVWHAPGLDAGGRGDAR